MTILRHDGTTLERGAIFIINERGYLFIRTGYLFIRTGNVGLVIVEVVIRKVILVVIGKVILVVIGKVILVVIGKVILVVILGNLCLELIDDVLFGLELVGVVLLHLLGDLATFLKFLVVFSVDLLIL
jgi:hypothetical protein